ATAFRHGAESRVEFLCRHCSAAAPPGCTPEQCAMKSDRQAARMALSWWELGFCGPVAAGGAPEGDRASVCTGFGVVTVRVGGEAGFGASAGGAATPARGPRGGEAWTRPWEAGGDSAALPFRDGNNAGPRGRS